MTKYYKEAKNNAAFDRCVDVMTRMIQKYGHQVLENQGTDAPQMVEDSWGDKQVEPVVNQAA